MCKSKRVARANGTYATTKAMLQQTHLEALCFIPFRSVVLHPIATNEKAKMNVQVRLSSDLLNHLDHGAASEADCEDCWAVFVLGVLGAVGGPGAPSSRPERPRLCEKCLVRTLAIQHLPRFRHRSGRSGRHVKVDSMLAGLEVAPGLELAQEDPPRPTPPQPHRNYRRPTSKQRYPVKSP